MNFLDAVRPPYFSFRYGGEHSTDLLSKWKTGQSVETNDQGELTHIAYREPATGLKVVVHVQRFDDSPAIDWVVELTNEGDVDTPIIEDILALDASIPIAIEEHIKLHYANGSGYRMDDFQPQEMNFLPKGRKVIKPIGGKSSSGSFPFMNLKHKDSGMVSCCWMDGAMESRV